MNKLLLCIFLSVVTLTGTAYSYYTPPPPPKKTCYNPFAILPGGGVALNFNIENTKAKTLIGACSACGSSLTPAITTTYLRDTAISNNAYSKIAVTKVTGANLIDIYISPGEAYGGHVKVTTTKRTGSTTDYYTKLDSATANTWEYGFNDDCTIYFKEVATKKYLCLGTKFTAIQGADYDSIIAKGTFSKRDCSFFPYLI